MSCRRAWLLALSLTFLVSCGGAVPPTHYYVLEPHDVVAESFSNRAGLTIGVRTFQVDPPYDQDRIVYRAGDESAEVGFYAYHRWAAPLARMLPRVVSNGLGGVPGVFSIEPAASGREYEASLRGRVLAIEEIDTPGSQRVRVRVDLTLTRKDGTEIWSQILAREAPVPSKDVAAVVHAVRTALAEEIRDSRQGLERILRDR